MAVNNTYRIRSTTRCCYCFFLKKNTSSILVTVVCKHIQTEIHITFAGLLSKKYFRWRRTNDTPAQDGSKVGCTQSYAVTPHEQPGRPTADGSPLGWGRGGGGYFAVPLADEHSYCWRNRGQVQVPLTEFSAAPWNTESRHLKLREHELNI